MEMEQSSNLNPKNNSYDDILSLLIDSALPEQQSDFELASEPVNYKEFIKKSEANLSQIISLLDSTAKTEPVPISVVIHTVLLCGEHSNSENWTSSQTIACTDKLLREICISCNVSNLLSLLMKYNVQPFLHGLRPKLQKDSWKNHPAALVCFMWLLLHLKCPHLGDVLNPVLPTCLLLVDDHLPSNKIKGLQCLQHIVSNVSCSELNNYGRGSLIYNAIEHMIYTKEHEVIPELTSCLVPLLIKTEYSDSSKKLLWSHFDDVLNIWLSSMELEQKLMLRDAYIDSLNKILGAMGLASVRWSKKLLGIFTEYCEQEDTCNKSLTGLLTFITATWPRLDSNFSSIAVILLKVCIRIEQKSAALESTLKLVKLCFHSMEKYAQAQYNLFLNQLKNNDEMNKYYILITDRAHTIVNT